MVVQVQVPPKFPQWRKGLKNKPVPSTSVNLVGSSGRCSGEVSHGKFKHIWSWLDVGMSFGVPIVIIKVSREVSHVLCGPHINFIVEFHLKSTNNSFCTIPKQNQYAMHYFYVGTFLFIIFELSKFWIHSPCRLKCV